MIVSSGVAIVRVFLGHLPAAGFAIRDKAVSLSAQREPLARLIFRRNPRVEGSAGSRGLRSHDVQVYRGTKAAGTPSLLASGFRTESLFFRQEFVDSGVLHLVGRPPEQYAAASVG